ncbi:hypothetical protein E4U37_007270 [Claviceps purpurea]|nr:hypothetical protein E4U37_007270 [Claviceps purpurea]
MTDYGMDAAEAISRLSLGQAPEELSSRRPPSIGSAGIIPVDITERFANAVKTLEPGEIVKHDLFTLFDSVAALEIMDPKMDSGCIQVGEELEVLYDVSRSLQPEQVLGIIDQLICHEMSWHLGYPLSQTIFTSVYVEALLMPEPASTSEAHFVRNQNTDAADQEQPMIQVLRAYIIGLLKACGYVNQRIKTEHFYEEEDFVPNTYNRTLLERFPTTEVQDVLRGAVELVLSLKGSSVPDDVADALVSRLDLRMVFLEAMESPRHMRDVSRARAPWDNGLELLSRIETTHCLATAVDDAFSMKLQRKLASTMPPRPIVRLEFQDAFGHFSRLFRDGSEVVGVLQYADSQCLQTFVHMFQSQKPQPLVYIRTLLQTFLFDAMEVLGFMSIRQLLDDNLSIITLPAHPHLDRDNDEIEAPHDVRFVMSQQMELFRQRAAQPFLDIFRTACQNRCRVRRTLCHLIRDWEALQVDAEDVDQLLQIATKEQPIMQESPLGLDPMETYSLPLSSWTYLYKLRQMEAIVQLGFELEIYQVDEMAGMYWYLNYLAKSRLQHAERVRTFIVRQANTLSRSQPPARVAPGFTTEQQQQRQKKNQKQLKRSLAYTRLSLLDAAVTWELSDALCCLYTVLQRHNLIKPLPRPYSDDLLRFDLRMKPFSYIGSPALPTFEDFTHGSKQPGSSTVELLDCADRAVTSSKRGYEALSKLSAEESFSVGCHERWVEAAKKALKSCIATGVAVSTLRKAVLKTGGNDNDENREVAAGAALEGLAAEIPTPEKAYHEWWIVPRIGTVARVKK